MKNVIKYIIFFMVLSIMSASVLGLNQNQPLQLQWQNLTGGNNAGIVEVELVQLILGDISPV